MFVYLIFLIHIMGCFWAITSNLEEDDEMNWVKAEGLEEESTFEKYLTAIYWAIYSVQTIGYGDIEAVTIFE